MLIDTITAEEAAHLQGWGLNPHNYVAVPAAVVHGLPWEVDGIASADLRVASVVPVVACGADMTRALAMCTVRMVVRADALEVSTLAAQPGPKVHRAAVAWADNATMTRALRVLDPNARDLSHAPPAMLEIIAWTSAEAHAWIAACVELGARVVQVPQVNLWGSAGERRPPGIYPTPLDP